MSLRFFMSRASSSIAAKLIFSVSTVIATSGCSFISPTLKVNAPNTNALKTDDNQHFVTTFQSCFSPPSRIPSQQTITRQLFVGWNDVMLGNAVQYETEWKGFEVVGTLDDEPVTAIAISKPSSTQGCLDEVVAFAPRNLDHEADLRTLSAKLSAYLKQSPNSSGSDITE